MDDAALQQKYFKEQLTKGLRRLLSEQLSIAQEKIYSRPKDPWHKRSGRLRDFLASYQPQFTGSGAGLQVLINYPIYIRFLDMKKNGNLKIYNRPVWGILYRETWKNIKYEYRDWLREQVSGAMQQK